MTFKFKTTPRTYQLKAFKEAVLAKRFALWLDPRLGKTKIAIDFCAFYHTKGKIKRVVVVCPLAVAGVWEEELEIHCPVPYTVSTKAELLGTDTLEFYIASYGYVAYRKEEVQVLTKGKNKGKKKIERVWVHLPEYLALKPDCLITDEAHYIKDHSTDRSKSVDKLSIVAPFMLELTGTPQPKDMLDLWHQFNVLCRGLLGTWTEFKQNIAAYDFSGFKVIRWNNIFIQYVRKLIKPYHIRIRRKDVHEVIEPIHQRIPIRLPIDQQKIYDKMKKDSYLVLTSMEEEKKEVTADIILTQYLRLQQISGGFIRTDDKAIKEVGDGKEAVLLELLPTYTAEDEKVVIYCRFTWEVEKCLEVAKRLKLKTLKIMGSMTSSQRTEARKTFQTNDEYKVIVCQIKAGGIGINLNRASTAIFYSLVFNHDEFTQACDRIYKEKQLLSYIYLLGKGTIDEYIFEVLQKKERLNNAIVNWKEVLR